MCVAGAATSAAAARDVYISGEHLYAGRCEMADLRDSFTPALFQPCDPGDEQALAASLARYLALMNRYFATLTFEPDKVVVMRYKHASSDELDGCRVMSSGAALRTFRGMQIVVQLATTSKNGVATRRRAALMNWWLGCSGRRTFEELGFYPDPARARRFPRNFNLYAAGVTTTDALPKSVHK